MSDMDYLAAKLEEDGAITEADVESLDAEVMSDGVLNKKEKGLLFAIINKLRRSEQVQSEAVDKVAERISADGIITRVEIDELHAAIMEDGKMSSEEQLILRKLVSQLSMGILKEQ